MKTTEEKTPLNSPFSSEKADMNIKLLAFALLGLCAATCVRAKDFSPADYIDVSRHGSETKSITEIRDIVERDGSEDPEITAKLLLKLKQANRDGSWAPEDKDFLKFLSLSLEQLLALTRDDDSICNRFVLDNYLHTIYVVFGESLDEFFHQKPTHDTKLHAFLVHYGRMAIKKCSQAFGETQLKTSDAETEMDDLVGGLTAGSVADIGPDQRDSELLSKAKELDLLRGQFKARNMLDATEKDGDKKSVSGVSAHKRLQRRLTGICARITSRYGHRLEVYNLTRLLIPDQVDQVAPSTRFLKLNEYWRICLPLQNPKSIDATYANIKNNIPTVGMRLKSLIK